MVSVVPFLLMMVALVLGAAILLERRLGPRVVRPIREACCARCRYALEGLASATCPECGADLEQIGVSDVRDPRHRVVRTAMRTGVLLVAALIAWPLLTVGLDSARPSETIWTVEAARWPSGVSTQAVRVERVRRLASRKRLPPDELPFGRIRMRLDGPATPFFLDESETSIRDADPAALEREVAAAWLARWGEVSHPAVVDVRERAEAMAADAVALARHLATAPPSATDGPDGGIAWIARVQRSTTGPRGVSGGSSVAFLNSPARWPGVLAGGLVAVAALAGLRRIRRGHRAAAPIPWSRLGGRPEDHSVS